MTLSGLLLPLTVAHSLRRAVAIKAGKDLYPPPEFHPQTSEYPVILSLENHCSVEQQKVMAQHMSSILGPALLTQPLGDTMPTCFPSPEVSVGFPSKPKTFRGPLCNT